jgi:L-glutamine:2-deoxy-scyllo-inosose/3-amino-2,3-dideoxy-scyllo-inosose aminotransferase
LAEKLDALRNCGRRPETEEYSQEIKGAGFYSDEGNFIQSGNYRITEFQAAILVEALKRLPEQNSIRDKNGLYMNSLLFDLPGVSPMRRDKRETKEAYFNFAFRYHQDEFNSLPVDKFRKAFESELGIGVDSSYEPLNICSLYAPLTKPARYKINDPEWAKIDPSGFKLPVCERIFKEESVCLPHKILLGNQPDMDLIAKAIEKIRINSMEVIK